MPMHELLKGNYQPRDRVAVPAPKPEEEGLEARFEREALKRLGGSIAFVAKKKVQWELRPGA